MKWNPLIILLTAGLSLAATLPYQGLATDAKGRPIADGLSKASFALYPSPAGGAPLWSESQDIQTTKGLFFTQLGRATAIPDSLLRRSFLYLGVALNGGTETNPRLELATPPYAVWSRLSDSALTSRRADTAKVAWHLIGEDSLAFWRVRDSLANLAARRIADSVSAWIARDSVAKLASRMGLDSARRDRDSATLRMVRDSVGMLGAKAKSDSVAIASLSRKMDIVLSCILPGKYVVPPDVPAWNPAIRYGYLLDERDGRIYRTVKIGSQTWMAENLNFAGMVLDPVDPPIATPNQIGVCSNHLESFCTLYGRWYTWEEVMQGASSSDLSPSKVQGICPTGWHVPSNMEWNLLEANSPRTKTTCTPIKNGATECVIVDIPDSMGVRLSASTGWNYEIRRIRDLVETDDYGFRALPGGGMSATSSHGLEFGNVGLWWTSTTSAERAILHFRNFLDVTMSQGPFPKTNQTSVRCVKD
ncbi:MAG: hypothetical protein IPK50_14290 [Fibrobacterota bacterium]|nr:MAG: hypothetical protein IPK50_14290 [Fibrobacterota bacterium]